MASLQVSPTPFHLGFAATAACFLFEKDLLTATDRTLFWGSILESPRTNPKRNYTGAFRP